MRVAIKDGIAILMKLAFIKSFLCKNHPDNQAVTPGKKYDGNAINIIDFNEKTFGAISLFFMCFINLFGHCNTSSLNYSILSFEETSLY